MDICCIEECGAHSVRPMLVAPSCDAEPVSYYPCLPACTKTVYCCEKPKPKHHHEDSHRSECHHGHRSHHKIERRPCSPPNNHQDCCYIRPPTPHPSCCEPQCKPVKTKYIIPCYRYEDGRIVRKLPVTAFKRNGMQDQEHGKVQGAANFLRRCSRDVELECDVCPKQIKANQPTVLMRRACEVAVGNRPRKKPYVETRFIQDADHQESRYIREDEENTRCPPRPVGPCAPCAPCPQYCMEYPPCMTGRPAPCPPRDCYYCYP